MAVISLVLSVVIATNIAELSPRLRARIRQSEREVVETANATRPARARDLLARPRIWAHAVGITMWLVLYLTLAIYGPAMLVDSFGVSTARASAIMSTFWVLDLVVLIAVGRLSDRLRLRKPFALGGTLAAVLVAGYLAVLMGRSSVPEGQLMLTGALLGASLGVAFGPWMANYSEDAEDVDPRLQGTAWGIFGFASRTAAVLVLLVVPPVVAATSWRTWLLVSLVCLLMFIPAVFAFGGRWRRPANDAAAQDSA
jgi:OPA family glycerol-3-phosphate transporter-like MFS transporter